MLLQHAAQGGDSAAALPPACAVSDSDSDSDNSTTDAAEIYRQYAACCSNMQRKGVIAPQHFPRLVRTVFGGTVGPNNVTIATGETQQMYVGIRSRNQTRVNQPAEHKLFRIDFLRLKRELFRLTITVFGGTVGPNNVTIATGETQQMYVGIRSRNQTRVNQPAGRKIGQRTSVPLVLRVGPNNVTIATGETQLMYVGIRSRDQTRVNQPAVGPNNVTISTGETQQMYVGIRSRNQTRVNQPAVGPNNVTIATGETQQMYVGIRSRNQNRVNQPAGM
ncbi:unnamed protein product [Plutella xylostella]|uniref:(diamondback moth) hypothetical protein n=1 Tax=Plutella xylostella TaxID=51655 RepID=A0A8S4FS03_PLUXY|nr:unnamed protein product [Plutella xylostella]